MREFEQKKPGSNPSSPFFDPKVQKKLSTGTVGERYEVEADNVADKVVKKRKGGGLLQSRGEESVQQKPISETISTVQKQDLAKEQPIQKKGKEKEEYKKVQKKSDKEEDKKTVQKKGEKEEDKKVQKKSDKEEDKKAVQKKGEKEENKKVQKKSEKEEDKKTVQKKGEKKEDKKVQKKSEKEEDKKTVQKKGEKEEDKKVQKKSVQAKLNTAEPVNEGIENDLNNSKGNGNAMDKNTKQEMESGFGADFNSVNIHTDSKAVQMSEQLGAQAFTHGNDIYFNKGKYNPDSKEGKHLLAHELTHTIQQTGSKTQNSVQKQTMLQLSTIPWNIKQWTTQVKQSDNFKVNNGGKVSVKSNLGWAGTSNCNDITNTIEIEVYKKRRWWMNRKEHSAKIALSGGSTSISNLTEGNYYVKITLSKPNKNPTLCSLEGSLSIDVA